MNNLLKNFQFYLKQKNLTDKSIKNYISDIRRFFEWTAKNNLNQLTQNTFSQYRDWLINQKTNTKSINRYLSSIRMFGLFLQEKQLAPINPTSAIENVKDYDKKLGNIGKILREFQNSLVKEKLSQATIRNYISDVKQFLEYLEQIKKLTNINNQ